MKAAVDADEGAGLDDTSSVPPTSDTKSSAGKSDEKKRDIPPPLSLPGLGSLALSLPPPSSDATNPWQLFAPSIASAGSGSASTATSTPSANAPQSTAETREERKTPSSDAMYD